jgi:hypothetical protein
MQLTAYYFLMESDIFIANLNRQHLLPKLDEIEQILNNSKSPKSIGLCETSLNDNINNNYVYIRNNNCERRDRSNRKGGGIISSISKDITCKRRKDFEINDIESIWFQTANSSF